MKIMRLLSLLSVGVVALSFTGTALAQAQEEGVRAFVQNKGADGSRPALIYIVSGNERGIKYKTTKVDLNDNSIGLDKIDYFFEEPLEYRAALDLYANRKYAEALKGFKAVQSTYASMKDIPYNYSLMAEYRAYSCELRLMNIAEVAKADTAKLRRMLPMDGLKNDLTIFDLWKVAHKKDWAALETAAKKQKDLGYGRLTRAQIAQVSYLLGLAYSNLGQDEKALDVLGEAMLIDSSNSLEITKEAILRTMEIYSKDQTTAEFVKNYKTAPKDVQVPRYVREGAALMNLWKNVYFISPELPKEYENYINFYVAPPKPQAKEEPAKPADAKAPAEAPKATDAKAPEAAAKPAPAPKKK